MDVSLDFGENEYDPLVFVEAAQLAEKVGFKRIWFGDHFMPWIHSGNRSAYVWSVIPVVLDRSSSLKVGPYVTSPIGGRYHPAIVAQAAATIDNMYPGRFLLGVGTGEAVNEYNFFVSWPSWRERAERLVEGLQLMRMLFERSEPFDFNGKYFSMKNIMLYTKPKTGIPIYFSAVGEKAAYLAGKHAGNLVTLASHNPPERIKHKIIPAFEQGLRDSGRNPSESERLCSVNFTFDDPKTYIVKARKTAGLIAKNSWEVGDPRRVEDLGQKVDEDRIYRSTVFCNSWDDLLEVIKRFEEAGITEVVLYTGPRKDLIREVGEHVIAAI
jgi:coenzyme F420-dependent glucose-6-phosphate dehydrogenase